MHQNSSNHGALRLLLAAMVAASHLGVQPGGYHIGVVAVVVFYLLAGMVAGKLLAMPAYSSPWSYWRNRWQRIAPLYFFSLAVATVAWLLGARSSFLSQAPGLRDWLANLTIIPLSFYMYTGQDTFTLIPPAWSLGVELQFYLLAPFLVRSRGLLAGTMVVSFIVFVLAVVGKLHPDYFGYRLLPGVLFVFLAGVLLSRVRCGDHKALRMVVCFWLAILLVAGLVLVANRRLAFAYEVLAALLGGGPVVYFFSSPLPRKIDKFCGSLSYGLFLLHFPAWWFLKIVAPGRVGVATVLLLALGLGAGGHLLAELGWRQLASSLPARAGLGASRRA